VMPAMTPSTSQASPCQSQIRTRRELYTPAA
jgi:hypothetical protein